VGFEEHSVKTKEYARPIPATWFLHNRHLVKFIIRELTSIFVLGFAIFLIVLLYEANRGGEEFRQFYVSVVQSGWIRAFLWLALVFILFHSITSFNAAPTIMAPRWGEDKIDPRIIIGVNYGLWLIVSLIVLIIVLPS
jgi:fumarate reductase subunit C